MLREYYLNKDCFNYEQEYNKKFLKNIDEKYNFLNTNIIKYPKPKSMEEQVEDNIIDWYTFSNGRKGHSPNLNSTNLYIYNLNYFLDLSEEELEKLGPKVPLLSGLLASFKGNYKEAILFFDEAASGFLENEDLFHFAIAESKLALSARHNESIDLAVQAHELAIQGFTNHNKILKSKFDETDLQNDYFLDNHVMKEYLQLAKTLSTPKAISQYGLSKIKQLRNKLKNLKVNLSQSVHGIAALRQTELTISEHKDLFPFINYFDARKLARLAYGGLIIGNSQLKKQRELKSLSEWVNDYPKFIDDIQRIDEVELLIDSNYL